MPNGYTYQNCVAVAVLYNVGTGYFGSIDSRFYYSVTIGTNNRLTLTPFNWGVDLYTAVLLYKWDH